MLTIYMAPNCQSLMFTPILVSRSQILLPGTNISTISRKGSSSLNLLRQNLYNCSPEDKARANLSLVRPILCYASSVWDPYTKRNSDKLEKIQRRAIRFVFNTYSWQKSVSALLHKLKWPDLSSLRKRDRVILMFKILKGLVAIPPEDYVTRSTTASRRKHDFKLNTFSPSLDVFKYSFFPRTVIDWNLLPAHVIHSTSLSQFRSQLDVINYEFL